MVYRAKFLFSIGVYLSLQASPKPSIIHKVIHSADMKDN